MKKTVIALLMMSASAPAMAADFDVESKITDVTVHPNLASLTRAGTITLPEGKHVLILNNLPVSITHYPFQLSAGGALLGKVTTTEVTNTHNMDARRKVLEAQLQSLEMEEQVVNDSIATAEIQIDMLKSMGQLNSAGLMTSAAADPSKWQASLDAMAKGASAAFRTIRDENAKLPELARKIRATESNLRNLGCECLTTNTLKAEIEVSGETTLDITLNYLVEGAFWEASHMVRADTDKSRINIQSMANITQVSGEDWVDVSLTLSTIDPDSDGDFVAYLPRYVATLFDPRQQMLMERSEVRHKRAAPVSFSPAVEDILTTDRSAQTVQSDFTLDYTWNKPFSLKSGGEDEIINLTAQSYSTKIFTRTTPEFSNDFFLTGTIEVGKEPLLWGEASIYLNGAYVGDFELPETYAGGTAMIPLGVDRQMGLNRVIEKSKEGDAGIFGGKRRKESRFRYDITNNHPKDIVVEVLDAWPTPLHEDIKVEALKSASKRSQGNVEGIPGHMMWRLRVESGKTASIRNHYSITYPANMVLEVDED